jgi:hypothetical protein
MQIASLKAKITDVDSCTLHSGELVSYATLNASYVTLVNFTSDLGTNQVKSRKRKRRGLPTSQKSISIWLHASGSRSVKLEGEIGFVAPMDAPAIVLLRVERPDQVLIGDTLEFEISDEQ